MPFPSGRYPDLPALVPPVLSYRDIEALMAERGVAVDNSTLNRWVVKFSPILLKAARRYKAPVGSSWRMDETYIQVRGEWKYLYRVVDKAGDTVDFLLTAKRNAAAALRFLRQAIKSSRAPVQVNIDCSGANAAALEAHNLESGLRIEVRQCRYLNNVIRSANAQFDQ